MPQKVFLASKLPHTGTARAVPFHASGVSPNVPPSRGLSCFGAGQVPSTTMDPQCDLWAWCSSVPQFPPWPGQGRMESVACRYGDRGHTAYSDREMHKPSPQPWPMLPTPALPSRARACHSTTWLRESSYSYCSLCSAGGGGLSPATISTDWGRSMLPVGKLSHRDPVHILAALPVGAGEGPSTEQAETPTEEGVCPHTGPAWLLLALTASHGTAAGPRTPDTGTEAAPAWGQAPGCRNEPRLVLLLWLLACPPPAAQGPLAAQPGTSLDLHSHGKAPTPPCSEPGQGTAPSLPAEPCCPCGVAAGGCARGVPSI